MKDVVIQKFGGTSLSDERRRSAASLRVKDRLEEGKSVVVVVSALGRRGAPYSTDSLLGLAHSTGATLCNRNHDLLLSCGELIASVIMSQSLAVQHIDAFPMSGAQAGIITNDNFANAQILRINTSNVREVLQDGAVPVVAGFQGISEGGEVTTIGRGGSDTTACALGAALNAERVEIYTDVPGVMTADPFVVDGAQILEKADYYEILALAQKGAKVLHPAALTIAAENNIPLYVGSFERSDSGTLIKDISPSRPVTGVASNAAITFFRLDCPANVSNMNELQIFDALAEAGISVNFIDFRTDEVTFLADSSCSSAVEDILAQLSLRYELSTRYAKVSVVGVGMTGQSGMMSKIVRALSKKGVTIVQATDSPTSISCLVAKEDEELSLRALHEAFDLDQ